MAKILISILSDYLQPNFLLIKELEGEYDKLMFITTNEMKRKEKGIYLEKALGLMENSTPRIDVIEDDFDNLHAKLKEQNFGTNDKYIINLTGGTKLMSIAVYEFFQPFDAVFYYVPIGKNVIKKLQGDMEIPLRYRLNLFEYFTLNGLRYEKDNVLLYPIEHTNKVFSKFRDVKFNRKYLPELKDAQSLADNKDKRYYGGVWFEEYVYNRLKLERKLGDDFICKSAKIYRANSVENDNEIDVMFIENNQLYVFECKVSMFGNPGVSSKDTIEGYLYKLAAIAKDFGLRVNSYLLTLHKLHVPYLFNEQSLKLIYKRATILGVKNILDNNDFVKAKINL